VRRSVTVRLERTYLYVQRRLNFHGRFQFTDRSADRSCAVIVLAGYKPHLWDLTLPRLMRFIPPDVDVCLTCPGVTSPSLEARAAANGWSYLSTGANYPSLALNLAIRHHPSAVSLLKLDEDVFIGQDFVARMLAAYRRVEDDGAFRPGFVAPTLNLNGFSYVRFLQALGLVEGFSERFGAPIHAAGSIPVTEDGVVAHWIWARSVPFDGVSARISAQPPGYSTVPHKFSIGAILFRRDFWQLFGGFKVRPFVGGIGVDEAHICAACVTFSRVMAVAHDVFAGHFSFAPQDSVMRAALAELRPGLELVPE